MAKQFVIVWTETATSQRRAILKYWIEKNGTSQYAKKLIILIRKRVRIIAKNPNAFRQTDYNSNRVSAMGHFSIFYKVVGRKVVITAFWDSRQDPSKLLKILKK